MGDLPLAGAIKVLVGSAKSRDARSEQFILDHGEEIQRLCSAITRRESKKNEASTAISRFLETRADRSSIEENFASTLSVFSRIEIRAQEFERKIRPTGVLSWFGSIFENKVDPIVWSINQDLEQYEYSKLDLAMLSDFYITILQKSPATEAQFLNDTALKIIELASERTT